MDGFNQPTVTYFELPTVLVPPEQIELDNLPGTEENAGSNGNGTDGTGAAMHKKDEWPSYQLRFFDNTVSWALKCCWIIEFDLLFIDHC